MAVLMFMLSKSAGANSGALDKASAIWCPFPATHSKVKVYGSSFFSYSLESGILYLKQIPLVVYGPLQLQSVVSPSNRMNIWSRQNASPNIPILW